MGIFTVLPGFCCNYNNKHIIDNVVLLASLCSQYKFLLEHTRTVFETPENVGSLLGGVLIFAIDVKSQK